MRIFDPDIWREIWVTITRNKTRSVLTAFGVSWGIFMLVILLGLGNSFRGSIMGNLEGIDVNSCLFMTRPTTQPYKGYKKGRFWSMNNRDLKLLRANARSVELAIPYLVRNADAVRGNKKGNYSYLGVIPDCYALEKHIPVQGRLLGDADNNGHRKVCVIGERVYETLFDIGEQAAGQFIRVGGIYYQVIGVIRPVSENVSMVAYPPNTIYIPFNTMQRAFNFGENVSYLGCTVRAGYDAGMVTEEVSRILKENHDISPSDENALFTYDVEKQFRTFTNVFKGVDILIWIVGLGALFSGIIGISNIMLVTVRERMREIGIRRALGARPSMILGQIMSESLVLTALAGITGMIAGIWLLELIGLGMSMSPPDDMVLIAPTLSFSTAMAALAVLIFSGVLAGIIPATMAMKIKAIDAIRDE